MNTDAPDMRHARSSRRRWLARGSLAEGERFDLDSYLQSNQHGVNTWVDQELLDPEVQVVGDTAVLTSVVRDRVDVGSGRPETFVMPMTQTSVRRGGRWVCLAGHAGPSVEDD